MDQNSDFIIDCNFNLSCILSYAIYLLTPLLIFYYVIYPRFLRKAHNLHERYNGGWAIVTGASDGIGYEYCIQLASRGFDIILIARNIKKLEFKAKKLREKFPGIQTECIKFDFDTWYSKESYSELFLKLDEIPDISILVNNVGALWFKPFEELTHEEIDQVIRVNNQSLIHLTRYFLPRFLKRSEKWLIINVGAGLGCKGFPGFSVYGATKAFLHNFIEGIQKEYKGRIDILLSIACPVHTNMNPEEIKVPFSIPVQDYVGCVMNDIGYTDVTYGHYKHELLGRFLIYTPLVSWIFQGEFKRWKEINQTHQDLMEQRMTHEKFD